MFFYIINHFTPKGGGPHLAASTLFAASLAVQAPQVSRVLVVDGSEKADEELAGRLAALGAHYHHEGRQLSFAEGYNAGLARSDQPWTILSASDIYPNLAMFSVFEGLCRSDDPSIGCVIPTLNNTDLGIQEHRVRPRKGPIDVPLMTLNLNAFPTTYLREIGGVSEQFSGNYNDVVLADRFKQDGRRIVLAPVGCVHYGNLTLQSGKTNVSFERDKETFQRLYPGYIMEGAPFELDIRRFTDDWKLQILFGLLRHMPRVIRKKAGTTGTRLIVRPFR